MRPRRQFVHRGLGLQVLERLAVVARLVLVVALVLVAVFVLVRLGLDVQLAEQQPELVGFRLLVDPQLVERQVVVRERLELLAEQQLQRFAQQLLAEQRGGLVVRHDEEAVRRSGIAASPQAGRFCNAWAGFTARIYCATKSAERRFGSASRSAARPE